MIWMMVLSSCPHSHMTSSGWKSFLNHLVYSAVNECPAVQKVEWDGGNSALVAAATTACVLNITTPVLFSLKFIFSLRIYKCDEISYDFVTSTSSDLLEF